MAVLDCRKVKEVLLNEIRAELKGCSGKPSLAIVQVEGDNASCVYVKNKKRLAEELGLECEVILLPNDVNQQVLNQLIFNLSKDDAIDGVVLQLPLPRHLNADEVLELLDAHKDVDGLTGKNQGYLAVGDFNNALIPATPYGVLRLLEEQGIKLSGLDVVVVGRSRLFGLPMSRLLMSKDATVTVCHSKTKDLKEKTRNADIVIVGVGCPEMFNASYFSDKTKYVIDVGISLVDGKLKGDVATGTLPDYVGYTTTPGGTGQLTVPCLLHNVVTAYKRRWEEIDV